MSSSRWDALRLVSSRPAGSRSLWVLWAQASLGLLSETGLVAGLSAERIDDYALGEWRCQSPIKAFQLGPESSATERVSFALGAAVHTLETSGPARTGQEQSRSGGAVALQPHTSLWGLSPAGAGGTREVGTVFCKAPPHPYHL